MQFDLTLILANAGLAVSLAGFFYLSFSLRNESRRRKNAEAQFQHELESCRSQQETELGAMREELGSIEQRAQNMDEVLKGGITRSSRSQALQMIRSGVTSDSAASLTGMARRETRLLERVSQALAG